MLALINNSNQPIKKNQQFQSPIKKITKKKPTTNPPNSWDYLLTALKFDNSNPQIKSNLPINFKEEKQRKTLIANNPNFA